jgi:hypothetical protein
LMTIKRYNFSYRGLNLAEENMLRHEDF